MIIGLCGPEGGGKSTAAKLLTMFEGYEIWPFAGPLKAMLRTMGIPERHLTGTPADKLEPLALLSGKSAREAMQTLGTEWGRNCINADLWVKAWAAGVGNDSFIVADDVRFPNEVAAIRELGGVVICVVRSANDFSRIPQHASEDFAALNYDHIVINDGSRPDLLEKINASLGKPSLRPSLRLAKAPAAG